MAFMGNTQEGAYRKSMRRDGYFQVAETPYYFRRGQMYQYAGSDYSGLGDLGIHWGKFFKRIIPKKPLKFLKYAAFPVLAPTLLLGKSLFKKRGGGGGGGGGEAAPDQSAIQPVMTSQVVAPTPAPAPVTPVFQPAPVIYQPPTEPAGAQYYAPPAEEPPAEPQSSQAEMPPEEAFPEETAAAAEESSKPLFAESTTSFYEQPSEGGVGDMAFEGDELGFDFSSVLTPLTQLATTAGETYAKLQEQKAQQAIAAAQARAAEAQAIAAQAAGKVGKPAAGGTNWPLYLGLGGGALLIYMLVLKGKRKRGR